jgi:AcrR family transcriptional regulator
MIELQRADWRAYKPLGLGPVLSAAVEAFVEVGYHGAAIRDIARRSGLSVPGLYHHYQSKQALLAAILDVTMEDLLWRSYAAGEEGGRDCVARFALLVECLTLYHTYRRDLAFIGASEMRSLTEENRARIRELRVEQQRMVDAEVEQAITDRRFTTLHPHEASRAVVTMCTAIPQWYRPNGPLTPEHIAERYVEFALRLMGHPGPATRLQSA